MSYSRSADRRRCNDECIKRIAAHLCQLQNCDKQATTQSLQNNTDNPESGQDASNDHVVSTSSCCPPKPSTDASKCCKQVSDNAELLGDGCCQDEQNIKQENCCKDEQDVKQEKCCENDEVKDGRPARIIGCGGAKDENASTLMKDENSCCTQSTKVEKQTKESCCKTIDKAEDKVKSNCCSKDTKPRQSTDECCGKEDEAVKTGCCTGDKKKTTTMTDQCDGEEDKAFKSGCCSNENNGMTAITASTIEMDRCKKDSVQNEEPTEQSCADECCASDNLDDAASACTVHLQNAIQRYEYLIRLGRCLCHAKSNQDCMTHAPPTIVKPVITDTFHEKCAQPVVTKEVIKDYVEIDVEAAPREHIVVNVAGMTCTGCVKKINNVMKNIPDIYNPVVTFVNETAEFDTNNAATVITRIEKETGFKLTRIVTEYQQLDIEMNKSVKDAYKMRPGIIDLENVGKNRYRLTYDPATIGARDLLYDGIVLAPPAGEAGAEAGQKRLYFMLASFVASAIFTIPVLVLNWGDVSASHAAKQRISLPLASIVQIVAIPNFYQGALTSLIHSRVIEMDMLVVISISAAYVYSVVAFGLEEAGVTLEIGPFFETSTLLITLVILGRLITAVARIRAIATISVRSLQLEQAELVSGEKIDARLLQFGDQIKIRPHSRIVTDGRITAGGSAVDESMLTGESMPVMKKLGDQVTAGTLNGSGLLEIQLTRLPGSNSITDIAATVQDALVLKPKIQDLADKLAGCFVPVVVLIGLVVFLIWIGVTSRNGVSAGTAISYAIAVMAVSCPCALGLAVPMVLVIAGAISARNGVIVRAADAFERAHKTTDVVFDKTGTLTFPELHVVEQKTFSPLTEEQAFRLTKSLVKDNTHPVSAAVNKHLDVLTFDLTETQSIPGCGIEAIWCGSVVRAGNSDWLGIEAQDSTSLCVTIDGQLAAIFNLRSILRPEAKVVIAELHQRGITCHVASGDAAKVVEAVATGLGIEHFRSRHTPAEKQKYVQELQKHGKVIFVGDGTNDAVAVAQADIGIQIGSASDVTDKVADVVLLGSLGGITTMLDLSRRCFRLICFNFAWSGIYNLFAILLASGAFVKFRLPPAYAGLGEIVSVLPVILAASSLVWWKAKH